jgi:hypothetical protein
MKIKDIVKDWGGFEELVADLHKDGKIEVQHNVTLTGQSGATRQIDVLIKQNESLTLIECKYWKKRVERANIDVLYAGMEDLNACKGIFFTTTGYQEGAKIYAESKGITIFVIRDLSDEEWGLPGEIVDFYTQIISKTLLSIELINPKAISLQNSINQTTIQLNLNFGGASQIQIISELKNKHPTLEDFIENTAHEQAILFQNKNIKLTGENDTQKEYFLRPINIKFNPELQVFQNNRIIIISEIKIEFGIKILQSRIKVDRSDNYTYVLAVEDCINNEVFSASKRQLSEFSEWNGLNPIEQQDENTSLKNGSIISVVLPDFFDQNEMPKKSKGTFLIE